MMRGLFSVVQRLAVVRWYRIFEDSRLLQSYCCKVILIATDGLTKGACIGAYLFGKRLIQITRRSGALDTALYLKQYVPNDSLCWYSA